MLILFNRVNNTQIAINPAHISRIYSVPNTNDRTIIYFDHGNSVHVEGAFLDIYTKIQTATSSFKLV